MPDADTNSSMPENILNIFMSIFIFIGAYYLIYLWLQVMVLVVCPPDVFMNVCTNVYVNITQQFLSRLEFYGTFGIARTC